MLLAREGRQQQQIDGNMLHRTAGTVCVQKRTQDRQVCHNGSPHNLVSKLQSLSCQTAFCFLGYRRQMAVQLLGYRRQMAVQLLGYRRQMFVQLLGYRRQMAVQLLGYRRQIEFTSLSVQ